MSRASPTTSNLALDPDLDSYYMQDLAARKLPAFLRQLAEVQILALQARASGTSNEHDVRAQILESLLRSVADEVRDNLAAAYRGNPDGRLRQAIDGSFATMLASTNAYLGGLHAGSLEGGAAGGSGSDPGRRYGTVVQDAVAAWTAAQSELDRLLGKRIDGLVARMDGAWR